MKRMPALLYAAAMACGLFGSAHADSYPSRPIRLIVPFPAGGASDILARVIGKELGQKLGETVVVEDRPGAGGNLGSDYVAKASPDGYTLLLGSVGTHAINPSLYARMPYDPIKDFAPISLVANVPTVLVVNPKVPVKSVRELISYAKAKPGKLNYASAGLGTTQHLAGELFKMKTGADIVHVPYKGGGPAVADLLGGQVQLMFPNIPVVSEQIRAGQLRPLGVAADKRSVALPDVPTIAEAAGLSGFNVATWFGILAPADTPKDIVSYLNNALTEVVESDEVKSRFGQLGLEPLQSTPDEFRRYIRSEIGTWTAVVKKAAAHVD
jgi:tripartite-type tricarboxylate transporter receptor subunit TctC